MIVRLTEYLTSRFGRGFSRKNLQQMRFLYLAWPVTQICQTPSDEFTSPMIAQTASAQSAFTTPVSETLSRISVPPERFCQAFTLPLSAHVRL